MSEHFGITEYHKFLERERLADTPMIRKVWVAAWNRSWDMACDGAEEIVRNQSASNEFAIGKLMQCNRKITEEPK